MLWDYQPFFLSSLVSNWKIISISDEFNPANILTVLMIKLSFKTQLKIEFLGAVFYGPKNSLKKPAYT